MDQGLLRFPLRLPLVAAVAVVSYQFLLFCVHRNDRQPLLQELLGLGMDILKLSIAVGMLFALQGLDVTLQTIPHLMEKLGHLSVADTIPLPLQLLGQMACTLAGPSQERFRVTSSHRLHQLLQCLEQIGMMKQEWLTASSCSPNSSRRPGFPAALLQFANAG